MAAIINMNIDFAFPVLLVSGRVTVVASYTVCLSADFQYF